MKATRRIWFLFTLVYLVIDYGRPQDIMPPIGSLRPGALIVLVLSSFLLVKGGILMLLRNRQMMMTGAFVLLLAAYVPFAVNNYFAFMAARTMLLYVPFILSTVICVDSVERLKKMILVFLVLMVYISAYGILHSGVGSGNYFKDENDLSLFINMWLPFCYFGALHEKRWTGKTLYLLAMAAGITAVVASSSRGGFLGLACVMLVCWLYSARKLSALVALGMLALMLYAYAGDAYWARMDTMTNTDAGTAFERLKSWEAGWRMFLDNPLGVGGENFQVRFPEYQPDEFLRNMWGRVAHSLWFTLIPELGIPGILIYSFLLFYNLKDVFFLKGLGSLPDADRRYLHSLSLSFLASMAGYFASGSFLSVLYYPHYWYLTALIVAAARIARQSRTAGEAPARRAAGHGILAGAPMAGIPPCRT
ncbi:MAG TPA: O-antigen ligase family protein [Dissulfurispiraceae bacterium]